MEVDATEVDDDDETFLKNYDEAYAVYEANNPDLIRADGTNDIIKEGHNKNYPNIIYLKMLYGFIVSKNERDEAEQRRIEAEQRRIQTLIPTVSLQPNNKYAPYLTYDFGPTMRPRNDTPFDSHFVSDDPSSMLLYMHLHGSLIINQSGEPSIMEVPGVMLNKFSMSGTGKCNSSPVSFMHGILYRLCDAVQNNAPIDMETILNQTNAHEYAKIVGPERALSMAPTMSEHQHNIGTKDQDEAGVFKIANKQTQSYKNRFVETLYGDVPDNNKHTYGTEYVDKIYAIIHDGIARDGIFICKEWGDIRANCMDNLMDNMEFKLFIFNKYHDMKNMSNLTETLDIDGVPSVSLKNVTLSDVLEFCARFGRRNVSMVDSSCSNFMTHKINSVTTRQIAIASDFLKTPKYVNVAKGSKRTKKGSRYNKTTRVKGNRGKPKGTKKGKRVIKNKRTRGR